MQNNLNIINMYIDYYANPKISYAKIQQIFTNLQYNNNLKNKRNNFYINEDILTWKNTTSQKNTLIILLCHS